MIKAEYPQEEALYFIAEGDPALAILVRAMDVARYKLRPRGERGECARGFKDNTALERAVFCMDQGAYGSEFQELFGHHVLTRAFR
jgi:hypothetical protein